MTNQDQKHKNAQPPLQVMQTDDEVAQGNGCVLP